MAVDTTRRLAARLQRLGVETLVVIRVRLIMKKRSGQIGKLLARAVATLALKISSWSRRRRSLRAADDCSFIWSDWRRLSGLCGRRTQTGDQNRNAN